MIRTITRLIFTQNYFVVGLRDLDSLSSLLTYLSLPFMAAQIDRRYLREYRCPTCNRLLSKGFLKDKDSYLEVMCRICKTVQTFTGEDAEIIQVRHELIKKGVITGHELSEGQKKQE